MPLGRGDTFGRYVVEAVLGAGGGGEVYRAHDTVLKRAVALKVLLPGAIGTEQVAMRARILREARAAAQLNHPNVVSIFDVGEYEGVPYMAMELVPGRPLRAYVGATDVPMERRLRWLSDVALALDAAHKLGLVHRDVKPENVIVRDEGFIKVVDFGIARQTTVDPSGPTAIENTGASSAGTPHYMAPEQIKIEPLDGRADQFGWGVTAYELLSGGALPWDASGGSLRYVASVLGDAPVPLRDRASAIPPAVATIVERTLRRSRDERFQTMAEIAHALDPLRSHSGPDVVRHVVSVLPPAVDLGHQVTTKVPVSEPEGASPVPERTRTRTAPPRRTRARAWAIAVILLAATTAVMVKLRRHGQSPRPGAASSSVSPAPAPTPVTKLPLPSTKSQEALAAYIEGLQAIRDGSSTLAIESLRKAVGHDPMLARAHLTLAPLLLQRDGGEARASYARARALRSLLSERDQGLLEALEPFLARSDMNAAEGARRLAALAERYPLDAEIWQDLQFALAFQGNFSEALAAGKRALSIDPEFYGALAALGEVQAYTGELDEALLSFARCIDKSGASTYCSTLSDLIFSQRGECDRMEQDARRLVAANPGSRATYPIVAEGMMARGAPIAAVRQMLEQEVAGLPEKPTRGWVGAMFRLDVATGDFVGAEAEARRYAQIISGERARRWHALAADQLADLSVETGRAKEAGAIAHAMLEAQDGWTQDSSVEDEGIAYDTTPSMLAFERAGGLLGEDALVSQRAEWLAGWEARAPRAYWGFLWLQGYSDTVATADDARRALAALEHYGGAPAFRPNRPALVGRVYFLADRLDDALPFLLADARSCTALRWPFAHVRALYWLGRGYEAKGDVPSACAAYEDVLDRWGTAKPRSVTADDARKRAQSLGCTRGARDR